MKIIFKAKQTSSGYIFMPTLKWDHIDKMSARRTAFNEYSLPQSGDVQRLLLIKLKRKYQALNIRKFTLESPPIGFTVKNGFLVTVTIDLVALDGWTNSEQ